MEYGKVQQSINDIAWKYYAPKKLGEKNNAVHQLLYLAYW